MASITIRNLSQETKERLRLHAVRRGCSLEALARSILDSATVDTEQNSKFPYNLIALLETGDDLEPYLQDHDQPIPDIELK